MVVLVAGDGSFAFGVGSCDDCLTKVFRGCDGCVASKVADVCFAVVTFVGVGCL